MAGMGNEQWGRGMVAVEFRLRGEAVSKAKADFGNYNEMQPHRIDLSNLKERKNVHYPMQLALNSARIPEPPNGPFNQCPALPACPLLHPLLLHLQRWLHEPHTKHETESPKAIFNSQRANIRVYCRNVATAGKHFSPLPPVHQIAQRIPTARPFNQRQRLGGMGPSWLAFVGGKR